MDTDEKPRRPWWRRKRWRAALIVALVAPLLFYPTSARHALFLVGRGDLPSGVVYRLTFFEAWPTTGDGPAARYGASLRRSVILGRRDRESQQRLRFIDETLARPDLPRRVVELRKAQRKVTVAEREEQRSEFPLLFR